MAVIVVLCCWREFVLLLHWRQTSRQRRKKFRQVRLQEGIQAVWLFLLLLLL